MTNKMVSFTVDVTDEHYEFLTRVSEATATPVGNVASVILCLGVSKMTQPSVVEIEAEEEPQTEEEEYVYFRCPVCTDGKFSTQHHPDTIKGRPVCNACRENVDRFLDAFGIEEASL